MHIVIGQLQHGLGNRRWFVPLDELHAVAISHRKLTAQLATDFLKPIILGFLVFPLQHKLKAE
ncbi:hypothetical protein D3C77_599950 [compost metagenome]